ncbi:LysR family transcriptional regulator [Nocardia fusca]|uniref:LysR family transcriptional regulator n=1 Tax=Nocardia fusca TaxID=941183 RepID=UPI0012F4A1F9
MARSRTIARSFSPRDGPCSRQIRALEQELGCTLLERTTRSVQLTPSGAQLYEEARGLFTTIDSAVRREREVDRGVERLVVGFASGLRVSTALRAFAEIRPEVEVELFQLKWWERELPLRDGRADVGYLRRPFDGTGLRTVTVATEPKVACLPVAHRLAGSPAADRPLLEADLVGSRPSVRRSGVWHRSRRSSSSSRPVTVSRWYREGLRRCTRGPT